MSSDDLPSPSSLATPSATLEPGASEPLAEEVSPSICLCAGVAVVSDEEDTRPKHHLFPTPGRQELLRRPGSKS